MGEGLLDERETHRLGIFYGCWRAGGHDLHWLSSDGPALLRLTWQLSAQPGRPHSLRVLKACIAQRPALGVGIDALLKGCMADPGGAAE